MTYRPLCDWTSCNKQLMFVSVFASKIKSWVSLEQVSLNFFTIKTYWYLGCSFMLLKNITYDRPHQYQTVTYRPWRYQLYRCCIYTSVLSLHLYMFPLTISPSRLIDILDGHYCTWTTLDKTVLHQYQTWHTDHSVTGLHVRHCVTHMHPRHTHWFIYFQLQSRKITWQCSANASNHSIQYLLTTLNLDPHLWLSH